MEGAQGGAPPVVWRAVRRSHYPPVALEIIGLVGFVVGVVALAFRRFLMCSSSDGLVFPMFVIGNGERTITFTDLKIVKHLHSKDKKVIHIYLI